MLFRIGIEASGITIKHGADIGRDFVIAPFDCVPDAQKIEDEIDLRPILPGDCALLFSAEPR